MNEEENTKRKPGRQPNASRNQSARENKRVPFGAHRSNLTVGLKKDPNYMYRWFNDINDRIQRSLDAGYVFVERSEIPGAGDKDVAPANADLGSRVSKLAGKDEFGNPYNAYLMKINKDMYFADQRAKQAEIKETEEALLRGDDFLAKSGATGYVTTANLEFKDKD